MKTKQELRDEIEEMKSEIEFLKVLMLRRERAHRAYVARIRVLKQEVPE